MKKKGILNVELSAAIAALGHKQYFLIGDAGMPIPPGIPVIDLVLTQGIPTFAQVFSAIAEETEIEGIFLATEIQAKNPGTKQLILETLPKAEENYLSHEELKKMVQECVFAVRTGENTPFANVICRAGVAF